MVDGNKNEAGYALLYALGAIVLSTLMIGTIFLIARTAFLQIETVDKLARIQDVQEYALQQATAEIKKKMDTELAKMSTVDLGSDEKKLKQDVQEWFQSFSLEAKKIGSNDQFSYTVSFEPKQKFQVEVVLPYVMNQSEGNQGWQQASTYLPKTVNTEITFHLVAKVQEDQNGTIKTREATSDYVYQVQWQEVDSQQEVTNMDIWRYVFYSYYLPNDGQEISADSWLRKMDRIYRFQTNPQPFNYNYNYQNSATFGYANGVLTDIKADRLVDFSANPLAGNLTFEGSFFAENGLRTDPSSSTSGMETNRIEVSNLFVLKNQPGNGPENVLNYIKQTDFIAKVGTYVDLNSNDARVILFNKEDYSPVYTTYRTGNLLINNTNSGNQKRTAQQGFLLGSGHLDVKRYSEAKSYDFSRYLSEAAKLTPKDSLWDSFASGHLVIASSSLYAGPVNESKTLHSEKDTERWITVEGNFMLTNAKLSSTTGVKDYSYFDEKEGVTLPYQPSRLTLSGKYTSMRVAGSTFIDAPKLARRKSAAELSDKEKEPFDQYYQNPDYWNTITLKDGAVLHLGYTGVEPFVLQVEKSSRLSMKLLPGLAFFDTTFLEEAHHYNRLKGQVVLEPFNIADQTELAKRLSLLGIPYKFIDDQKAAEDGVVSIIKSTNGATAKSSQMITRTFDFVKKVND